MGDVPGDLICEMRRGSPERSTPVCELPECSVPEGNRRLRPDGDTEKACRPDDLESMSPGEIKKTPPQIEGKEGGVVYDLKSSGGGDATPLRAATA